MGQKNSVPKQNKRDKHGKGCKGTPVKLYGGNMSTNAVRVLVVLEELGANYEQVPINFATGEHKSPAHFARNPFGQVPAFEDGELKLFESRAISRYVARKFKSSGKDLLRGNNLKEAALVDLWLDVEAHQFNPAINPIFYQLVVVPIFKKGTPDQNVIDEHVEKLSKVLDVYEERLSKSKYLAGDFVSLADFSHVPLTNQIMRTPYASLFESRPHVNAWWQSIASRPAVQKVLASK